MILPLGSGEEFDRVREIIAVLSDTAGPIGDDTAALPEHSGRVVVSTDSSVEGVHFRRDWLSLEEIGWRATAAALSDLAAAAARPLGVLTAVSIPAESETQAAVQLMRGVGDCCRSVGCQVLGGDLTSGPVWSITVTVLGSANPPLSRRGAVVGDRIWVTGRLGGARAALTAWQAGAEPAAEARISFARPQPRIATAAWLAAQGATAMLDLSDGLAGDLEHLAAASGVALEVTLDQLPLHPAVVQAAEAVGMDPREFAALGGEDYELLVTLPAGWEPDRESQGEAGTELTWIGAVTAGSGVRLNRQGKQVRLAGYRHRV